MIIEISAIIFSLLSVYFNIKSDWKNWILSIIACILYAKVYFDQKLWANFGLQFVFIFISLYGIWKWKYHLNNKNGNILITRLKSKDMFIILFIVFLLIYSLSFFIKYEDWRLKYLDIISTALSIVALYLSAQRKIENWYFWIITNILLIILFWMSALYFSLALYVIFLRMAWVGHQKWQLELKK
jgi:nicotinamide mononucleotide transporter